jgi:hypothetical protein
MSIAEVFKRNTPLSPAEKLCLRIVEAANEAIPTEVWVKWPSHSKMAWEDKVFKSVMMLLKEHNFREAG